MGAAVAMAGCGGAADCGERRCVGGNLINGAAGTRRRWSRGGDCRPLALARGFKLEGSEQRIHRRDSRGRGGERPMRGLRRCGSGLRRCGSGLRRCRGGRGLRHACRSRGRRRRMRRSDGLAAGVTRQHDILVEALFARLFAPGRGRVLAAVAQVGERQRIALQRMAVSRQIHRAAVGENVLQLVSRHARPHPHSAGIHVHEW